jgi:UDP-N-acetylglucosamine--N-acetylmuramyl-(pentapeptide) pyrophosphoryl-undecaprenol N-acetylglucosamine transferase
MADEMSDETRNRAPSSDFANRDAGHHALLAGGGTGGHIFPALAVAEELVMRGWRVTFAGSRSGLEAELVAGRGLELVELPAQPLVGRGPVGRSRALWTLARSVLSARREIRKRGVDAVVGTGGYVSAPAVLGARLAGRPCLLVEPNVEAGLANRWLSRWADGAAVAYEATADHLHCPAWVTGIPVRRAFFEVPELAEADDGPIGVLVLGGSQGARQLNLLRLENRRGDAALGGEVAGQRDPAEHLRVLHQAGRNQLDETREVYARRGPRRIPVKVVPFVDDVAGAMADSHLVVSRAGALATAELCAAGRPSVLVPLALAGGHQSANARHLAEAGAARVVTSEELTPERLARVLAELVRDPQALAAAGRAARALARADAVEAIAHRLEELLP